MGSSNFLRLASIFCIVGTVTSAHSETLCAKNQVKLSKQGKIKLAASFQSSDGTCPSGYTEISTSLSAADILDELSTVDGASSGLDADTLDGLSSSSFLLSSNLLSGITAIDGPSSGIDADTLDGQSSAYFAPAERVTDSRIIRVGNNGGDYSNLSDAIAACAGSSLSDPYLIKIAPGSYSVTSSLLIPEGVHIQGSGIDTTTIVDGGITGNTSASGSVFRLSLGAKISDLSISSTGNGGGSVRIGIFADAISDPSTSAALKKTIIDNVRIVIDSDAPGTIIGIRLSDSDVVIRKAHVHVTGAFTSNTGISSESGSNTHIFDSEVLSDSTSEFSSDLGIFSGGSSAIAEIKNTQVTGYDGAISINDGDTTIHGCSLRSINITDGAALTTTGGTTIISHSNIRSGNIGLRSSASGTIRAAQLLIIDAADNADSSVGSTLTCTAISTPLSGFFASSCE